MSVSISNTRFTTLRRLLVCIALCAAYREGVSHAAKYQVTKWIAVTPPTGGYDFLTFDPGKRLLYVAHATSVAVINPDMGSQVDSLTGTGVTGVHGAAISPDSKFAFITSGSGNKALKMDLATKMVVAMAPTGANPDHILYDAFSDKVITFNNSGASATVIDPATMMVVATVKFSTGAKPEVSVSDGAGKLYVNLDGIKKIAQIDTAAWTVKEWALPASCTASTGLAIDIAGHRLFTSCDGMLAVTNADTGAAVGQPIPTGAGADGAAYDPDNKLVFTTNGTSGNVTIIQQMSPDMYMKLEDVPTGTGCRTNAYDPKAHQIYSVCSRMGALSVAVIGAMAAAGSDGGASGAAGSAGARADASAGGGDSGSAGGSTGGAGSAAGGNSAGSTGGSSASGAGGSGGGQAPSGTGGGQGDHPHDDSSGCSCRISSRPNDEHHSVLLTGLAGLTIGLLRRRRGRR